MNAYKCTVCGKALCSAEENTDKPCEHCGGKVELIARGVGKLHIKVDSAEVKQNG